MAITATILLDLVDKTQILSIFQGDTLIDTITYSNNTVTFNETAGFNLSQSDCLLYQTFFVTFYKALSANFPIVNSVTSISGPWPLCQFDINFADERGINIIYTQTSQGNPVYATYYTVSDTTASYSARSQVTITMQEFYMNQLMTAQYSVQVGLN